MRFRSPMRLLASLGLIAGLLLTPPAGAATRQPGGAGAARHQATQGAGHHHAAQGAARHHGGTAVAHRAGHAAGAAVHGRGQATSGRGAAHGRHLVTRSSHAALVAPGCRRNSRACRGGGMGGWSRDLAPAAGVQATECPDGTMATLARGHASIVRCLPI